MIAAAEFMGLIRGMGLEKEEKGRELGLVMSGREDEDTVIQVLDKKTRKRGPTQCGLWSLMAIT